MKIYLVRHGETDWNRQRLLLGSSDAPLNAYGRQLAEVTREGMKDLPIDIAFSSPLSRAKETADIILRGRDIPLYTDVRLQEIDFGIYEGDSAAAMEADPESAVHNFFCHPERYARPEGGESIEDVFERSHRYLREEIFPLEGKYDHVLLVSHGAYILTILNELLGVPAEQFWKYRPENCSVTTLEYRYGKMTITDLDRTYYEERSGV